MKSKTKDFFERTQNLVLKGDSFIKKNGLGVFHLEAKKLLENEHLHELYNYKDLVRNTFARKIPADQNFKFLEFSDLPITIARGKNCFIDLYFWRRRPTTIHNHHFVGAFQCLVGNNVDCSYSFKASKKHTKYHSLGKLELKRERFLKSGDVESINFQDKFIHQNHHQCELTVNLTFRTLDVPSKNLSNFFYSGLKFEKSQKSLIRIEQLISLATLGEVALSDIPLSLEDAFNFVLLTEGHHHPAIKDMRSIMLKKIKTMARVDLVEIMAKHEAELDRSMALYE